MSTQTRAVSSAASAVEPNGIGAAAILAAGIGCFMLAFFAILGDRSARCQHAFIFSKPTGPLSGVTTSAVAVWLLAWGILHSRWHGRNVALGWTNAIAFAMLLLSLLLTFPPIAGLF